jgi:hypothetical protein
MGLVFVPLTAASLAGVAPADSGAGSSMVNVMQQVGGSLGLAILVTVFGTAFRHAGGHAVAGLATAHHALVHGVSAAFSAAALFDVAALLVIALSTGPAVTALAGLVTRAAASRQAAVSRRP